MVVPQHLHLFSIVLFSLACSIDNIGVGVSYGSRRVHIPLASNALIGALNAGGNLLAMIVGEEINQHLNFDTATLIGASLIVVIGLTIFIKEIIALVKVGRAGAAACAMPAEVSGFAAFTFRALCGTLFSPVRYEGRVRLGEGLWLGIALTFTNLAGGVAAGLLGFDPGLTTFMVFVVSMVTISFGLRAGSFLGAHLIGDMAKPLAGALLIVIGIYECLG
jgi:putative sporulation protein YtaF